MSEPNRDQDAPTQQRAKMQHDGQEYDFVFSIDVKDDEPALKLPFNNGQGEASSASYCLSYCLAVADNSNIRCA